MRSLKRELPWLVAACVAAVAVVFVVQHLWDMRLHIPFASGGDALATLMGIKELTTHAWPSVYHDIGYPFGSAAYDNTVVYGDVTQLVLLKILAIGSSDPAAILNAFYVLGYPICAASSYCVLRALGFGRAIAATCALVYAVMPYHMLRGVGHLFLSAYWAVPVLCWLVLGQAGHARLYGRDETRTGWRSWMTWRNALLVTACAFVGASEIYYAVFALLLVGAFAIVLALSRWSPRPLVTGAVVFGLILAAVIVAQLPELIWHLRHGSNNPSARSPAESEIYGLKLINMVLPIPDHRLGFLTDLANRYYLHSTIGSEGASPALGLMPTLGLLGILVTTAVCAVGRRIVSPRAALARDAGFAALTAFMLGTIGGGSALIAYLFSSQIRAWNRISIVIAFFAVIGLALGIEWLGGRIRRPTRRTWALAGLGLLAVVVFAGFDQSPKHAAPDYKTAAVAWQNDSRFVRAVEQALPKGSAVLQFPYVPYPENPPVVAMTDYEEFKGPLHSTTLSWSYGASKGRVPDDWGAYMGTTPMSRILPAAVAAGFDAVYVDRFGYLDRGAALEAKIAKVTGQGPAVVSADNRLAMFSLAGLAEKVRRAAAEVRAAGRDALIHPVIPKWATGFYTPSEGDGKDTWYWARSRATLSLRNTTATSRTVRLRLKLFTPGARRQHVTIAVPGGRTYRLLTKPGARIAFDEDVRLPAGTTEVVFTTDAPDDGADPRDLRMEVIDAAITDTAYDRLARAVGDAG